MRYQTILLSQTDIVLEITLHRPEAKNAINQQLLQEINLALDDIENNEDIRTIVLKGENGFFCTGMDFNEVGKVEEFSKESETKFAKEYMKTLKRFASLSKVVVSLCDGKVLAGGVGFAAASDVVIATPNTEFGLSEAIWGLLPANVMPYLIRRVGFQPAYFMTMTTKSINASTAKELRLVDVLTDKLDKEFAILNKRFGILHPKTIQRMKSYFRMMWIITEEIEQLAVDTLVELKLDPMVQNNIKNFVTHGKFPWEK